MARPNLLQAHLQKERQETEAQASAHQGHKSKEPPDPKDPKVVVPEPAEREPIEGERSSSHHAGALVAILHHSWSRLEDEKSWACCVGCRRVSPCLLAGAKAVLERLLRGHHADGEAGAAFGFLAISL